MSQLPSALETLGSLHAEDRLWLLGELDKQERLRLGELLGEEPDARPPVDDRPAEDLSAETMLSRPTPEQWAELLQSEPDWIVRPVLQHLPEPLRGKVIKRFPAMRRKLLQLSDGAGQSPALNALIVEMVQQAIRNPRSSVHASGEGRLFDRLVRRLRGEP